MKRLFLIAIFSLMAVSSTVNLSNTPASGAGADVYKANCETCHGEKGDGRGPLAQGLKHSPPDFTNKASMSKESDEELIEVIKKGKHQMPPFSGVLRMKK